MLAASLCLNTLVSRSRRRGAAAARLSLSPIAVEKKPAKSEHRAAEGDFPETLPPPVWYGGRGCGVARLYWNIRKAADTQETKAANTDEQGKRRKAAYLLQKNF